jgi:hypothetical protein
VDEIRRLGAGHFVGRHAISASRPARWPP